LAGLFLALIILVAVTNASRYIIFEASAPSAPPPLAAQSPAAARSSQSPKGRSSSPQLGGSQRAGGGPRIGGSVSSDEGPQKAD
jgi:hypothetical protein